MRDDRITKRVHQWQPSGRRSGGRPTKRWMVCIEEDLGRTGVSKFWKTTRKRMAQSDIAEYREQSRELVAMSVAESS